MRRLVGTDCTFMVFFTKSKLGATGLTVTCDVYDTDLTTLLYTAAAATQQGGGTYYYTLPAADFDTAGVYTAIFKTADATVDQQWLFDMVEAVGTLDIAEPTTGTGLPLTLSGLRRMLRIRLDDLTHNGNPGGKFTTEALDMFINLGYRETVVETKCHKTSKSITIVNGTHTYDLDDMFEPLEIVLGANLLKPTSLKQESTSLEYWNTRAGGIPTKWLQLTGPRVRLCVTPDATAASVISVVADAPIAGGTGYVVDDELTLAGGTDGKVVVTAVSAGIVTEVRLSAGGHSYTTGTKATTGGTGSACTVSITTIGTATANGYSHPTVLTNDADEVVALPDALAVQTTLDRAEWHARKARPTVANNIILLDALQKSWEEGYKTIRESIKAEGN